MAIPQALDERPDASCSLVRIKVTAVDAPDAALPGALGKHSRESMSDTTVPQFREHEDRHEVSCFI